MLVLFRAQELCESRGGRPGPSQIVIMVSVDVKQHLKKKSIEIDLGSCVEVEVDVLGRPK